MRLDHQSAIFVSGVKQRKLAGLDVLVGGVQNYLVAVAQHGNTHGPHRTIPGYGRHRQRCGSAVHREHGWILRLVRGQNDGLHTGVPGEGLGEQRANRSIHDAHGEHLAVLRSTLAPRERRWDLTERAMSFTVIHLQREEPRVRVLIARAHRRANHPRVSHARHDRAVCESCHPSGLEPYSHWRALGPELHGDGLAVGALERGLATSSIGFRVVARGGEPAKG